MKNNHSKIKTILSYCGIISFAGILVFCTSFSVYAARINDYANSPNDLATIQRYNKAMETCIPGGLGGGFSYDTSGSGDYKLENMQKSYDRLMGKQYFFNEYSGSLIYSEEFEKNVSQGNYDGGIFGSGNNDGKMYCGENNSILLDKSLGVFGLSKDADTLKSLYCNGNNDGIYKITKKKYDSNYKVVKEDSNCAENFDLFVKYANNKTTDPEYSISVSVADDAGNYYKQWFKQKVGDFSKLSSNQQKALEYAEASHNLQMLCSATGPSETSFGSKSEVTAYDATGKKVYYQIGVDADEKFYTGIDSKTEQTCADMAATMNEDRAKAVAAVTGTTDPSNPTNPNNPATPPIDDGGNTAEEQTCSNSGGAISLGWIVCPILTWMGSASESLYSDYIGPSLNINAGLFNDNTFSAWSTFQSLSNIIFIIFILIVIFSQLTGVGIDNYGIKKLLPKLIITAVLVNLSYIICELCVDLSNIIGASIKGLFDGMGANLQPIVTIENSNLSGSAVGSTAITGVAVLAALVGMVGAVWANPAILLTLFITAIGVIISIFFLFILLAARKAGVIVLAVASPIALVCYMLPNTQNIFKKYLKIAEGLLLVYPICGALVGGGDYVAKLLLSSGLGTQGFVAAFTAMVVGIVPIFFIPSVLKGSFAAMGNLGAKISGVGQGLRTRATKGIQGTERYRALQERGQQRSTRIRAGLDVHGNEKEVGKVGRFLRGGTRGMARSRAQYLKDNDTRFREGELMGAGFAAASLSQQKRAEKDQLANEMVLMNNATNNGEIESGDKGLFALYDRAMLDGNKTRARAIAEIAGRRKDTAARFLEHHEQLVASDEYRNVESKAAQDRIAGVMKQIATGDNAKNYRAADGVNFEYASQYNKGETDLSFSDWRAQGGSVDTAIEHNITNGADLYGQKGSSLKALRDDIDAGRVSAEKLEQLKKIYENTQNDQFKASGAYDATKDAILQEIYQKAGGTATPTGSSSGEINVPHSNPPATPQPMPYQLDATQMATARNYLRTHDLSNINSEMLQRIASGETAVLDDRVLAAQAELNRRSRTPGSSSK